MIIKPANGAALWAKHPVPSDRIMKLANSYYRDLKAAGMSGADILTVSTYLIDFVTKELRAADELKGVPQAAPEFGRP